MSRMRYYMLLLLTIAYLQGTCQALFSTAASIEKSTMLDFVLGEMVTEYTQPATIGLLPALYFTEFSSEKQLTDSTAIQVHFDNQQQLATVFVAHEMLQYDMQYVVCGADGGIYMQGYVTTTPYFMPYAQLPGGVYILSISGIPNHIPYTTKWIKK